MCHLRNRERTDQFDAVIRIRDIQRISRRAYNDFIVILMTTGRIRSISRHKEDPDLLIVSYWQLDVIPDRLHVAVS